MISLSNIAVPVLLEIADNALQLLSAWTRMYHHGHLALPTVGFGNVPAVSICGAKWGEEFWRLDVCGSAYSHDDTVHLGLQVFRLQAASASDPAVIGLEDFRALVNWWSKLNVTRSLLPLLEALLGSGLIVG